MPSEISNQTPTMSSREIAELVHSRHDKVKQSMERLADRGVITLPPLGATSFLDAGGKTQWTTEYRICKRDSYVVVAQLSPEFTARLVDRWQELEDAAAPAQVDAATLLEDPAALRGLLLGYADKVQHLQSEVATLAPKGEAYDRLLSSEGLFPLQHIGRALLCHPNLFISEVLVPKYCYREGSRIIARQDYVKIGLFENKPWPAPNGKVLFHAKAKAKALTYFAAVDIPTHVRNPDQVKASTPVPALAAATAH